MELLNSFVIIVLSLIRCDLGLALQTAQLFHHQEQHFQAVPQLTFAACYGQVDEVRRLLDLGADVNERDWLYQTPLHLAAKFNRMEVVRLLVGRGANVTARNRDYEESALHLAAKSGNLEMMDYLIDNGAEVNAEVSRHIAPGGTPLVPYFVISLAP